jgi:hypothetical protein
VQGTAGRDKEENYRKTGLYVPLVEETGAMSFLVAWWTLRFLDGLAFLVVCVGEGGVRGRLKGWRRPPLAARAEVHTERR